MVMKGLSTFFKTRALPSDGLVSYPGHTLGESYPSAETQSAYFTATADWVRIVICGYINENKVWLYKKITSCLDFYFLSINEPKAAKPTKR